MTAPLTARATAAAVDDAQDEPGLIDLVELAVDYADRLIVRGARDTHRATADRVHTAVNVATAGAGRVPHVAHRAIAETAYVGVGAGLSTLRAGLRLAARAGVGPRVDDHPVSRFVTAAVHGLIGDRLAEEQPHLTIRMAVRDQGRDVELAPERLAAVFPSATTRVAVFLHGMSESESYWQRGTENGAPTYAEALSELGWTPVFLRANTGLPIAENGVELSCLMKGLVASWPCGVEEIALVGHSMGGLILRAACDVRTEPGRGADWVDLVTHMVTLGTPHLGSPVARAVAKGAELLNRLPETASLGRVLDHRSAGVLDLEWGLHASAQPHIRYHLVAASLREKASHPVSAILGDSLVRVPSALGRDWTGARPHLFPGADVLHVGGADHFDLLNHPLIHDALKEWLR